MCTNTFYSRKRMRCNAFLISVLLCLCAMNVAAEWSPVWNDSVPETSGYAVFDPSFPDVAVVYSYGENNFYTVNVTTGIILWSAVNRTWSPNSKRGRLVLSHCCVR